MATRNRTRVFLNFRSAHRRRQEFGLGQGEGSDSQFLDDDKKLDRTTLPPEWVDIVDSITDEMRSVEAKLKSLTALCEARLKVSFTDDTKKQDREIDTITQTITRLFRKVDSNLKRIATVGNPEGGQLPIQERVVRLNVMRSLAGRIQTLSKAFKNKQKNFMMRKKKQESAGNEFFDGEGTEQGMELTDEQHEQMLQLDRRADQRQKDIDQIVDSIRQLNQIFREMSILVVEQGTVLDRIDYNIELTHERVAQGNVELVKANEYSAKASKKFWWCFFILLILIVILLGVVINKFQKNA